MSSIATTGCVIYTGSSRPFLTESMLAQFAARARGLRPRQSVFRRRLRGAARGGVPAAGSTRRAWRRWDFRWRKSCASSVGWRTTRHPPRSPSTCTCTGPGWPRTCGAPGISHCVGCWKRRLAAPSSRPAMRKAAMTFRCCCPRPRRSASTAATASPGANSSAASPRCGRTSAYTGWTRSGPSPENRPRIHAARHPGLQHRRNLGRAWACARRAATTRSSTACSCPTSTFRASFPRVLPGWIASCSPSSPGRCWDSATSTTAWRGARST